MNINEFINGYNEAQNKEKYLKKHVTTSYIDWGVKIFESERIVQMSCYDNNDESRRFRINSPMRYYLYVLAVIKNYTDVEIEDGKGLQSFDELEKNGITTPLLAAIGVDADSFQTVLKMTLDDHIMNYRDVTSWMDEKLEAIKTVFDMLGEISEDGEEKE